MKTKQANREITVNNVRRFWTIFVKTFRELVASWNSFEFLQMCFSILNNKYLRNMMTSPHTDPKYKKTTMNDGVR